MKFRWYDKTELVAAGRELVEVVATRKTQLGRLNTEEWTEFVLDWWAQTAPEGVLVDARRHRVSAQQRRPPASAKARRCFGEFMLDMLHSTYPAYDTKYLSRAYWDRALEGPLHIRLALESEWGHQLNGNLSLAKILDDASKVASIRADLKVIIFASNTKNNARHDIVDMLARLRTCADPAAPWLWLDVPWNSPASQADCGMLT